MYGDIIGWYYLR